MHTFLTVLQVFLSIALIGLVLIQHGRGADAGAAFGSGASATVFGARGSGSFLTRATGIIATLFFLTSMAMAYYAAKGAKPAGLMDGAEGVAVKVEIPGGQGAVRAKEPAEGQSERQPRVEVPSAAPVAPSAPSDVPTVPGVAGKPATSDVPSLPIPAPAVGAPSVPGAAQGQDQGPKPATD